MSTWILAIDFGTTSTAAARRIGDRIEPIQLENAPRMPSMVFWREATGSASTGHLVIGREADQLSGSAPWCLERSPKRRLGDEYMQLGDQQLRVVEVIGLILRYAYNEALTLAGGEAPAETRLTHPARWGKTRLAELAKAASSAGISDPVFIPEPVAAATHFASARLDVDEHVAVYDLGGGTLDTAVLRRTEDSFEIVGRPGGNEMLGGEDFDDLLYRRLGEELGGDLWQRLRSAGPSERAYAQANRELLRQARFAKEGLSTKSQYDLYMPPPIDAELEAMATEFERLLAPTLHGTVAELESTIRAARLEPDDMRAIYLAGGSSRIPLVGRLITERLGIQPEPLDDPKAVVSLGAARLEDRSAETDLAEVPRTPEPTPEPRPVPPPPEPPAQVPPLSQPAAVETVMEALPPPRSSAAPPVPQPARSEAAPRSRSSAAEPVLPPPAARQGASKPIALWGGEAYEVNAYGAPLKVRNPLAVIGLTVITLGVYGIIWYYETNTELKAFGRAYKDRALGDSNPTNSVLAIVPGIVLVIPVFISLSGFVDRVRRAQLIAQVKPTSGTPIVVVLVLSVAVLVLPAIPFILGYIQFGLNRAWARYSRLDNYRVRA
jgi:molecular chaperone DnaK